jgi:hypothetical protein
MGLHDGTMLVELSRALGKAGSCVSERVEGMGALNRSPDLTKPVRHIVADAVPLPWVYVMQKWQVVKSKVRVRGRCNCVRTRYSYERRVLYCYLPHAEPCFREFPIWAPLFRGMLVSCDRHGSCVHLRQGLLAGLQQPRFPLSLKWSGQHINHGHFDFKGFIMAQDLQGRFAP